MHIFETFGQLTVTLLSGFLLLSQGVIETRDHTLSFIQNELPYPNEEVSVPSESSFGDRIGQQLRNNPGYQQANVLDALTPPETGPIALEDALVHISCVIEQEDGQKVISGSGVFIDTKGIILTNAHIAQFFLLTDPQESKNTACAIENEHDTATTYKAEVLYISSLWIEKNAQQLYAELPVGTGERDFALLYTTAIEDVESPTTIFPGLTRLPLVAPQNGITAIAGGYPSMHNSQPVAPVIATTSIIKRFTFSKNGPIDLISIAPSDVGYHGSSGGPVVDDAQQLIGLIVTRGNLELEGERSLRALTIPYIDRALQEETGLTLKETLAGNLSLRAKIFKDTVIPNLRTLLIEQEKNEEQ